MKYLITIIFTAIVSASFGAQVGGLFPTGKMTEAITSIETAYPGETYVSRNVDETSGVVSYEIRFFDEALLRIGRISKLCDVVLVATNAEGKQLLSVPVDFSGLSSRPPSKQQFRSLRFSIHQSLEDKCVLNLGRHTGMRVIFTQYSLPLKSIHHKKAEQDKMRR